QAFLVAHEHAGEVRDPARVRGWLLAVLRSCYSKQRRKRQPLPAASVELDVNLVPSERVPMERPADVFDQGQLQRAIDALDEDFKIVVLMFYFESLSYRQIAAELAIPLGTVMSRLARAKAQLRRRLNEPEAPERPPAPLRRSARSDSLPPPRVLGGVARP